MRRDITATIAASFAVFTLAVACGDGGETVAPAQPINSSSTSSSSGSASGSSSGGASTSSSGGSTSSSGAPATGPCPTPAADTSCTVPDGENLRVEDGWVTTDASCKTSIYVNVAENFVSQKLRRYTMTTMEPCVLERDTAFGEPDASGKFAVDDAGNAFVAKIGGVSRVAGGVACTNEGGLDLTGFDEQAIAISPDGTTGYAAYLKHESGNEVDRKIVKLTATPSACSIAPFDLSGVTLSGAQAVAIDGKGRLHIADDQLGGGPNPPRVVIVDANGAFVSAYDQHAGGEKIMAASGLTRTSRGIFLDAFFQEIVVDDDGAFLSEGDSYKAPTGSAFWSYRSNARGPLFYIATRYGDPPAILVAVLKNR